MSVEQKGDMEYVMGDVTGWGEFDYVSGWYRKAAEYIHGSAVRAAFVSTNSIVQGEQATSIWEKLMIDFDIQIDFAFQTFIWGNEAKNQAKVHCVIVGFGLQDKNRIRTVYTKDNKKIKCMNINQYLVNGPSVFVHSRSKPICDVPPMKFGSMPRDGGGFILSEEEKDDLIKREPLSEKWIRRYTGAKEYINNEKRYCLWMVGATPDELSSCPSVMHRIRHVRDFRMASKAAATRKFAETPSLFCQIAQPSTSYILVPRVSSQNREYVPLGFLSPDVVASDAAFVIPDATLYHFGIVTSKPHMIWMKTVCGRLKSDYRYAKDIVYNNFPWPTPSADQRAAIESAAQAVLDVRAKYPESSLADLYDPLTMPPELRKAHTALDHAVMKSYGLKTEDESEIVAFLMKRYQELSTASEK